MGWLRIVATCSDPSLSKEVREALRLGRSHDEEVPDRVAALRNRRKSEIADPGERFGVHPSSSPALDSPAVEARELVEEDERLDHFLVCPCSHSARTFAASVSSLVTSAPASPIAPRFLAG